MKQKVNFNQASYNPREIYQPSWDSKKRIAVVRKAMKQAKQERENQRLLNLAEAHEPIEPKLWERIKESGVWLLIGILLGMWLH